MKSFRIGHGYDVHAFEPGDGFVLGGCHIAHSLSLVAHSDGDVLVHAICDALLGALALGDIGHHFPDTDPRYAGIDSLSLLRQVCELIHSKGFSVGNVDATIQCQRPKLAPHIMDMRQKIAAAMVTDISAISVKATTTEKLGFVGNEQGIAVDAVALLMSHD